MKRNNHRMMEFYTMSVTGIILAAFFLLVISGASAYRSIVTGQEKNNRDRALLSYILTTVKAGDAKGAVHVYTIDGLPILEVEDGDSGCGVRIYQYDGKLFGDYGKLDQGLNPEDALAVGETEIFQIEDLKNGVYLVTTDAGRVFFHVRSNAE